MLGFARRWGWPRGDNLAAVYNSVSPVSLVDRFWNDEDASYFGITANTAGATEEHSAVAFFTPEGVEFSVHAVNFDWAINQDGTLTNYNQGVQMFTPVAPFDPTENNTVGFFTPGLITNEAFNPSALRGISGTNAAVGVPLGLILSNNFERQTDITTNPVVGSAPLVPHSAAQRDETRAWDRRAYSAVKFMDPPLRILPNRQLAFQLTSREFMKNFFFEVSMLYTERRILE